MINIKLTYKPAFKAFKDAPDKFHKILVDALGDQSEELASYVIEKHLTGGTTDTKLAVRTGDFRRRTKAVRVTQEGDTLKGGVSFGVKYAGVHVGPPGQVTTITPKSSSNLAIPVGPALTSAGVPRYNSPRDVSGLQFIPAKAGAEHTGVMAMVKKGEVIPYFVLKKSIEVKARIHPEEIIKARQSHIERRLNEALQRGVDQL